ncbi:hypothetical protein SAMN05444266_105424 [Chitinophaga jiangningensis]|uniref:Uncharacterized protein n=1 Tax=Chitinophaga jiangningensis TaxID=1419482 RepID=A0A1M7EFK4_9BACT|nr:hypothetical protein [Chitinophaga jiangningensis]SHL90514.1 hypothetical protein SAMN05444266_105424 [Chitinophaga jiangningensis]
MRSLIAILLLLITGTAAAQRFPKDDLYDTVNQWRVSIDDGWFTAKTITYGGYTTSSRKNGISPALAPTIKTPGKAFHFDVSSNGNTITVQAAEVTHIAFLNSDLPDFLAKASDKATLYYTLFDVPANKAGSRWEMILKASTYMELNADKPAGILRTAKEDIRITANNRFGPANSYEQLCYVFKQGKKSVAAVIPGDAPRVWVRKGLDESTVQVLAAAIGALLLR